MKNNRGLAKIILLSIITFGIYGIVFWYSLAEDLNILCPNAKKTMNYILLAFIVGPFTLGIGYIVWYHKISNKMGVALKERGISYDMSAATFWIWEVLLSCIVIGPFVYIHKVCKAMNLLADDFNSKRN